MEGVWFGGLSILALIFVNDVGPACSINWWPPLADVMQLWPWLQFAPLRPDLGFPYAQLFVSEIEQLKENNSAYMWFRCTV